MIKLKNSCVFTLGMTLIELVIVVAVMGILLSTAVPSYQTYMLRVHRTEAIRLLLQASMCQERVRASDGQYDTNQCIHATEAPHYQLSYEPAATQGHSFLAVATPVGAQQSDVCGNLTIDQNGQREISEMDISVAKCWSSR